MSVKRLRDLCCENPLLNQRAMSRRQLLLPVLMLACIDAGHAMQIDIAGPAGSAAFGKSVTVLPNGNIVVTDPSALGTAGAAYLYSPSGTLISTLTGSIADDQVGGDGVVVLANGNYLIRSRNWDGAAANVGAVTWGSATTGVNGVVSASNSLVGSTLDDQVGGVPIVVLNNGNYVVSTPNWKNGNFTTAGAATWGDGDSGIIGVVSASNSLVGSATNDGSGSKVFALTNGNYVVANPFWRNGAAQAVGAITWCNGDSGCRGAIIAANALIGSEANDQVGSCGVTALTNGNYVVNSPRWSVFRGAVTWGNGASGIVGTINAFNSLIGATTNDQVGFFSTCLTVALSNGNYVVATPLWDNGALANVGAVTWGNGATGSQGTISVANSLIGSVVDDRVGNIGITALNNGYFVASSSQWNNGAVLQAGAVTWGDGLSGSVGVVAPGNSLVGTTLNDRVGDGGVVALSNNNYVVKSPSWDNGSVTQAGAVTWGNGYAGRTGAVSAANSLVGATLNDQVGSLGVVALSNGNYVVASPLWNNGAVADAGAATWGDGASGIAGTIAPTNSLVGAQTSDQVASGFIVGLSDGNYVVHSPLWNSRGAATHGAGSSGVAGTVTALNSLIGSATSDNVGALMARPFAGGWYVVKSSNWDNAAITNAGAVTLAGKCVFSGTLNASNSVLGTVANQGASMSFDFDPLRGQLVVGRPASNLVSLFAEVISCSSFE